MTKNILKLSLVGLFGIMAVCVADAAPAVKKLGGVSAAAVASSSSSSSAESVTPSRAGAIRITKPSVAAKANTASAGSNANTSRLSLGKYLHNNSVVKQMTGSGTSIGSTSGTTNVGGGSSAGLSSSEAVVLQDRVTTTENKITTVEETVTNLEESKQDKLVAGNGITIKDDGTIEAQMLLPVGSEEAVPSAAIWIE